MVGQCLASAGLESLAFPSENEHEIHIVPRLTNLTSREREVLILIANGVATKAIANMLGVAFKTADHHRSSLMRKLGIHDIAGLTRFAIRARLVRP